MTIQARPVRYAGVQTRSRTEARWLVFFDALNVRWEFEPRAFSLSDRGYLPDVWLVDAEVWCEIKPAGVPFDHQLAAAIQEQSGSPLLWVSGLPRAGEYSISLADFGTVEELPGFRFALSQDGALLLHGERDGERCRVGLPPSWVSYEDAWSEALDEARLRQAYDLAMSYRFDSAP